LTWKILKSIFVMKPTLSTGWSSFGCSCSSSDDQRELQFRYECEIL